jgi:NADPH:quinone reductase-like Zn-dependent oxidoreductase
MGRAASGTPWPSSKPLSSSLSCSVVAASVGTVSSLTLLRLFFGLLVGLLETAAVQYGYGVAIGGFEVLAHGASGGLGVFAVQSADDAAMMF